MNESNSHRVTRVMPGFKKKKTHLDITDDKNGRTVSFSKANYIHSKSKALESAKKGEGQKGFRALQEGIDKYHGRK